MLGFTVASALLAAAAGALSAGRIAERLGRLSVMKIAAVFFLLSRLGTSLAQDVWTLIAFRIVGGVGVGVASVIAPVHITEIAPAKIRGRLGSLQQLAIVAGLFLSLFVDSILANMAGGSGLALSFGIEAWRWMVLSGLVGDKGLDGKIARIQETLTTDTKPSWRDLRRALPDRVDRPRALDLPAVDDVMT